MSRCPSGQSHIGFRYSPFPAQRNKLHARRKLVQMPVQSYFWSCCCHTNPWQVILLKKKLITAGLPWKVSEYSSLRCWILERSALIQTWTTYKKCWRCQIILKMLKPQPKFVWPEYSSKGNLEQFQLSKYYQSDHRTIEFQDVYRPSAFSCLYSPIMWPMKPQQREKKDTRLVFTLLHSIWSSVYTKYFSFQPAGRGFFSF